jgi:peptidyl-dipeptidase Dcp
MRKRAFYSLILLLDTFWHPIQGTAQISGGTQTDGPFTLESPLPYHLPPFDKIRESDYRPALETGMAEHAKEAAAIAHNPAPPTFENTIVALERSGQMLSRVAAVFFELTSSNTSDELDKIQTEMAPKLSQHHDAIFLDADLFARIHKLFEERAKLGLEPESLRLLESYHTFFLRSGAALREPEKEKLRTLNQQLSELTIQFKQRVLKAANDGAVVVDKLSDMEGLSEEQIAAAAEAARARKLDGQWLIALQNTTGQGVLARLKNRPLRERIYNASIRRGNGGSDDNTVTAAKIVELRALKAALLGYPNHAAYTLENETAATPAAVNKMLSQLAPAAVANARREAADM